MNEILVQLRKPTDMGRMYYFRDAEVEKHLIFIESPSDRKMEYCINVSDGFIILMFDTNRSLINVEFIIPRKAYQIVPHLEIPQTLLAANLEFVGVLSPHPLNPRKMKLPRRITRDNGFSFRLYEAQNVPITVYATPDYAYAQILLGHPRVETGWITLSEQCLALIIDEYLSGFFFKLAGAPTKDYSYRNMPPDPLLDG